MNSKKTVNRREFIRNSALLGFALGFPTIVPSSVIGQSSPSNRINVALIGMGLMMGSHQGHLLSRNDVQVVAICDVDRSKRERAKQSIEKAYANKSGQGS